VRSQEHRWIDAGTQDEVARLHLYLTDQGEVGASGYPDPKRILVGRVMYRLVTAGHKCAMCAGRHRRLNPLKLFRRLWHSGKDRLRRLYPPARMGRLNDLKPKKVPLVVPLLPPLLAH